MRRVLGIIFFCGKAMGVTYSECASVVLVIQDTNRVSHIILCHIRPVRLYHIHPLYPKNDTIFRTNVLNVRCVF